MMLIYRGSVKDVYKKNDHELIFDFTDRYSIFDWGQMPDPIPGKGVSTAKFAAYVYDSIKQSKICDHHIIKSNSGFGETDSTLKPSEILVHKFEVPKLSECDSFYKSRPVNAFIPLEVIFRHGAPEGSSLLKRGPYKVGERFSEPIVEFSTKLDPQDRLLTHKEAQAIAYLKDEELALIIDTTKRIANHLKQLFETKGFEFWDGKVEFAFSSNSTNGIRSITLVDSIGLDELRLTRNGMHVSKEILRKFYRDSDWYEDLTKAKTDFKDTFREHCHSKPLHLSPDILKSVSEMYIKATDLICGFAGDLSKQVNELDNVLVGLK